MATAGYSSRLFCTTSDTNPTTSDIISGITSTTWDARRAELDTSVLGEAFTTAILGKSSVKPAISALYLPSDTGQSQLIAAFTSGNTVYLHYDPLGTGSCQKVGIKVSGIPQKSDQGGVVTVDYGLVSTTAIGTSTVS